MSADSTLSAPAVSLRRAAASRKTFPPGPRGGRALNSLRFLTRPTVLFERAAREYGDIFSLPFWGMQGHLVMITDPGLVKQVFTGDSKLLHAGDAARLLRPAVGSNSLLLIDEERHLEERRLMLPPFHGERLKTQAGLMREVTDAAIDGWPLGAPFPLHPRMAELTLDVIVRVVFGLEEGDRRDRLRAALRRLLEEGTTKLAFQVPFLRRDFGPVRSWSAFKEIVAEVDEVIYEEIARRREAPDLEERSDVFSQLVLARREDGTALGDAELRDQLVTLLAAGHETTATALAWTFELLYRNPAEHRRLVEAVDAGDGAYVEAAAQESLRLRPVIPMALRQLTGPMELAGYELPAGTVVGPNAYLMHRRPDVYPDPYRFSPRRFVERPPETYTFLPFGGGIRRCLGARFALMEMRIVLARVLERLELRPADARPEPVRHRAITLAPGRRTPTIAVAR